MRELVILLHGSTMVIPLRNGETEQEWNTQIEALVKKADGGRNLFKFYGNYTVIAGKICGWYFQDVRFIGKGYQEYGAVQDVPSNEAR